MANRFATQQVGVIDGSVPVKLADGRQVDCKLRRTLCSKQVLADAIGDTITLCTIPIGAIVRDIKINTDTSLGTSTIAVGVAGNTGKYVAATVYTTPLNIPTSIGPKASVLAAGPETADQLLIVTVAALALPVAAVVHFEIEYSISA